MASPDSHDSQARSVFRRWVADLIRGEACSFDELCAQHAELADDLRILQAGGGADLHGEDDEASLSARLASRYGSEVDPSIELEAEAEADIDFADAVMRRLSEHGGASTRYKLKGEVGRGGMGAVLRVWDEDLRRHLAMKVILGDAQPEPSGDTPQPSSQFLARFLEEAQVTGQLDHPGIVPVHELGLDPEGRVYFTMKLVKGQTFKDVIELAVADQEGWSRVRALEVVLKVCDAMAYAHEKGVIHRDLKPANVMVGRFGAVFVMDWGLARILGREDKKDIRIREVSPPTSSLRSDRKDQGSGDLDSPLLTMDGDVVGTPAYMSPEQARGELEELGPQTDVYAVGAMLYHLLSGRMPYVQPGMNVGNYAIWRWVCEGSPQPLHELASDLPAELVAICEKAMARDRGQRYADMGALAEDLRAFLEGRVVQAYETGAWAEARKWVRRNKPLAAALAAAAVLLVAGLGTALVLRQQAVDNFELAKENEEAAKEQERLAEKRAADVLSLSAFQTLDELTREAGELWPPWPVHLTAYDAWLERAASLVRGLEPSAETGEAGHRGRLEVLRERALQPSEDEARAERESHPRYGELPTPRGRIRPDARAPRAPGSVRTDIGTRSSP